MNRTFVKKAISVCLLGLSASAAYSGTMGPATVSTGKIYLGVFGGGGAVTSNDISQSGTAFFFEDVGGPLAVNAFGRSESSSFGMVGGHVGFAWTNSMGMHFPVTPAVELEGYYVGGATIEGHDIDNNTTRLSEHDFFVKYPLNTGVFLVNAVLNSNATSSFKPYVGVGIGSAILSVSGANSLQTNPAEPGVNHYNSNPNDKTIAFAAQPKIGVHYDLSPSTHLFAEYRFLYLSETNYTFGSTVYSTHAPTSPWLVKIKPQYYNMGTVGVDFDV